MLQRLRSSLRRVPAGGSPIIPLSPAPPNCNPGLSAAPLCHAFPRARSFVMAYLSRATATLARQDCSNGCSASYAEEEELEASTESYDEEGGSEASTQTFRAKDLIITKADVLKKKPDPSSLVFGASFTDHMLMVEWTSKYGWDKPHIKPFENLSIHPAASVLHYAVELFEGLKAFRGVDNKIRLFRPDLNMKRMCRSAVRTTLPEFDKEELLQCVLQLIQLDREWVPYSTSASLYIRPTFIGIEPSLGVKKPSKALLFVILSPVGSYFSNGTFSPVSLWANPKFVRSWKGGTGDFKMGCNYGSSLLAQCEAAENGCHQVLWLYGKENRITEVGTMNLFLYWINKDGGNRSSGDFTGRRGGDSKRSSRAGSSGCCGDCIRVGFYSHFCCSA